MAPTDDHPDEDTRSSLPHQLSLRLHRPSGFRERLDLPEPGSPQLADLVGQMNAAPARSWHDQLVRVGGCSQPLHLRGHTRIRDAATGRVLHSFDSRDAAGGVLLVRCGNRRASVCPSCARLYAGDVYHLVHSGLSGGKGLPKTVAGHPRVFVTLTAPSFGAVHSMRSKPGVDGNGGRRSRPCHPRRTPACEHGYPTACFVHHDPDDDVVGAPLCGECYDYRAAVVWQASVGELWSRFVLVTRRQLAAVTRRSLAAVRDEVRLSYVKVVEFQARGLVHVHAVIRADAATDDLQPPPGWVTAAVLTEAVRVAAGRVQVRVDGGPVGAWTLGWGKQLDVHDVSQDADPMASQDQAGGPDGGAVGEPFSGDGLAAYLAKYTTKHIEVTGYDWSATDDPGPRRAHAARMVSAAWALAEVPELERLRLGRWASQLAWRGHVSSKSRRYSTTLGRLRADRAAYGLARVVDAALNRDGRPGLPVEGPCGDVVVESAWELAGHGLAPSDSVFEAGSGVRAARRQAGAARARAGGRDSARREASGSSAAPADHLFGAGGDRSG